MAREFPPTSYDRLESPSFKLIMDARADPAVVSVWPSSRPWRTSLAGSSSWTAAWASARRQSCGCQSSANWTSWPPDPILPLLVIGGMLMKIAGRIVGVLLLVGAAVTLFYWWNYFGGGDVMVLRERWYTAFESSFPV